MSSNIDGSHTYMYILGCFVMLRQSRSMICIFGHLCLYWQSSAVSIAYSMIYQCIDLVCVIDKSDLVESK